MRVTYGRERNKAARRATVDISPESGTGGPDEGRDQPLAAYIRLQVAKSCARSFLPNPPASTDVSIPSQHRAPRPDSNMPVLFGGHRRNAGHHQAGMRPSALSAATTLGREPIRAMYSWIVFHGDRSSPTKLLQLRIVKR